MEKKLIKVVVNIKTTKTVFLSCHDQEIAEMRVRRNIDNPSKIDGFWSASIESNMTTHSEISEGIPTGVKDKNGKEIISGDIVSVTRKGESTEGIVLDKNFWQPFKEEESSFYMVALLNSFNSNDLEIQ